MDESLRYAPEHREPLIERNGAEYLITFNGSVFLALSLNAAESMARRMTRGRSSHAAPCGSHADALALRHA